MSVNEVMNYLSQYGIIIVFVIIFLEYLNLPGFPAGVIMPVAGIWSQATETNFLFVLIVSVMAGVVGSWMLYAVGFYGGEIILNKYTEKFPKQKDFIDSKLKYLKERGNIGVFISKLLPMVRTLISIPAGVLKLNFAKYTIYSAMGIFIWNGVLMGAGYVLGETVFKILG